jgi:hypothetical protein
LCGFQVVLGAPDPGAQAAAVESMAGPLARMLRGFEGVVIADCGRLYPGSPATPLVEGADLAVGVASPEGLDLAVAQRMLLPGGGPMIVTVGPGRYRPARVAAELDGRFAGAVPYDPAAVELLLRGTSPSHRSLRGRPLVSAVRALLDQLTARVDVS